MNEAAIEALRKHSTQRSAHKQRSVLKTLEDLVLIDEPPTITAVARAAGVSREFIYSHPELREAFLEASARSNYERARREAATQTRRQASQAVQSTLSRAVDRQKATIENLRTRVRELEAGRERDLGRQLIELESPVRVDALDALSELERVKSENELLGRDLRESTRLVLALQDQLAAARLALHDALTPQSPGDIRALD